MVSWYLESDVQRIRNSMLYLPAYGVQGQPMLHETLTQNSNKKNGGVVKKSKKRKTRHQCPAQSRGIRKGNGLAGHQCRKQERRQAPRCP